MMFLGALLEAAGIGLVAPAFAALDPQQVEGSRPLRFLIRFLGDPSRGKLLAAISLLILVVYVGKNLYLALLYYVQYRFCFEQQTRISRTVFASYLASDYAVHLRRNSAALLRNVNDGVSHVFASGLSPALTLVTEAMVVVVLMVVLVAVDPLAAFVTAGVLVAASLLFYRLLRRKMLALGAEHSQYSTAMVQAVNQGLGAIKEAKILGRESYFLEAYSRNLRDYVRTLRVVRTLNELPRLFLESLAVAGLVLVAATYVLQGHDAARLLPTLGVFALIGMRLAPSLNRIVTSLGSIRHAGSSLDILYSDLCASSSASPNSASATSEIGQTFEAGIRLEAVTYRYPETTRAALSGVSLEIPRNRTVAFVGPSGAGKSTVIDLILGLLVPSSGSVLVDGKDIRTNLRWWQSKVGYIPQPIYLLDDTIRRNVAFAVRDSDIDDAKVRSALSSAQLLEFVEALPNGLDSFIGENGVRISGGQRQRIGIARALYGDPEILVMDEATSALDAETEREIVRAIDRFGREKTILIVAHRLSTVERCDRVLFFRNGEFIQGDTYPRLLESNASFRAMVEAARRP